jgi:hypothetical protein
VQLKEFNLKSWQDEHSNCCASPAWKDRMAAARKRTAAQIKLKKSLALTAAVVKKEDDDAMMIEVAELEDRLEEQKRAVEAEKAASRARTRAKVLRHYVLPAALVTAGVLAGGAWMWRRRMR